MTELSYSTSQKPAVIRDYTVVFEEDTFIKTTDREVTIQVFEDSLALGQKKLTTVDSYNMTNKKTIGVVSWIESELNVNLKRNQTIVQDPKLPINGLIFQNQKDVNELWLQIKGALYPEFAPDDHNLLEESLGYKGSFDKINLKTQYRMIDCAVQMLPFNPETPREVTLLICGGHKMGAENQLTPVGLDIIKLKKEGDDAVYQEESAVNYLLTPEITPLILAREGDFKVVLANDYSLKHLQLYNTSQIFYGPGQYDYQTCKEGAKFRDIIEMTPDTNKNLVGMLKKTTI